MILSRWPVNLNSRRERKDMGGRRTETGERGKENARSGERRLETGEGRTEEGAARHEKEGRFKRQARDPSSGDEGKVRQIRFTKIDLYL